MSSRSRFAPETSFTKFARPSRLQPEYDYANVMDVILTNESWEPAMHWENYRLANCSLAAKLLITLFLGLVGPGYLVATANIFLRHQDADMEAGLTPDDLRATFHGMTKQVTPDTKLEVHSEMLEQVRPGGDMREYLDLGGEPAVQSLITWLEAGAKEADFSTGDPSPQQVIADHCIECHNADGGDMEDVPFAEAADAAPSFAMVATKAAAEFEQIESGPSEIKIAPVSIKKLVFTTHAHIFTIPMFAFAVGILFLMTGVPSTAKLVLAPLPLLATLMDIGSWWLARFAEPFIFVIAASGAIFGTAFALQILCILGSMWLGKKDESASQ